VHKLLLAKGARGELVRRAQVKLAEAGTGVGKVDGDYGDGTARAVAVFRRRKPVGS
jgi:peptidoglycan hydrolase-like protein with peptidoglycan-binding domain